MGAIRWSIHAASKLANVPAVALSKWKSGALPIGSTYLRHLSALEAVLLEEEARLARYLASLRSRPAGKAHPKLEAVVEPAQPREKSTASPDCGRSRP